jgi:hypothetical protein
MARNLKLHITLYLEKEVPVSTEITGGELLLKMASKSELTQK